MAEEAVSTLKAAARNIHLVVHMEREEKGERGLFREGWAGEPIPTVLLVVLVGEGVRMVMVVVEEEVEDIRGELVEITILVHVGVGVDHTTVVPRNRTRVVITTTDMDM